MSDIIGKGPKGVPRIRLFHYLLYLCNRTDHRLDELDSCAANQRDPLERLEHDEHIEQHLQWCVQHRLIAEVIILTPCSTYASITVSTSFRSVSLHSTFVAEYACLELMGLCFQLAY